MFLRKIVILGLISIFMNDHVCLGMKGLTGAMSRLKVSSQRPGFSSAQNVSYARPLKFLRNTLLAGGAGLAFYKAPDCIGSYLNEHKDDPTLPRRAINTIKSKADLFFDKCFIIFAITGNVGGIKYLAGKRGGVLSTDLLLAALCAAIAHKQEEIANLLLEQYGEKAAPAFLAVGLRYAVDTGQEKLVEFLLKNGADSHHINAQRVDGSMFNSLLYDLESRMMDAVDAHMAVSYDSLFLSALKKHYFKIVRLLLRYELEKNRDRYQKMLEEAEAKFTLERAS